MYHKKFGIELMADARTQKSQRALIQAGLKLLNKNKEITLSDIAKEAGVGRATLYRLYENKEALIEAIALFCLQKFEDITQPIEKSAKSCLHAFEIMFELLMPYTEEAQFLAGLEYFAEYSPEIEKIIEQQDKELCELIDYGKSTAEIDKDLPTSWLLNYVDALYYTGWCQQKQHDYTAKQASDLAFECFKRTVKPKSRSLFSRD